MLVSNSLKIHGLLTVKTKGFVFNRVCKGLWKFNDNFLYVYNQILKLNQLCIFTGVFENIFAIYLHKWSRPFSTKQKPESLERCRNFFKLKPV